MNAEKGKGAEGIDHNLKKEINAEGWEGNAAVLIGREEEMPQLRERLEKEGFAADLGSYIRMHKEIALAPADPEVSKYNLKEELLENKGLIWNPGGDFSSWLFIDKDGNVARIRFDLNKIAAGPKSKGDTLIMSDWEWVRDELQKLGFRVTVSGYVGGEAPSAAETAILDKRRRLEKEAKERKGEEFDF